MLKGTTKVKITIRGVSVRCTVDQVNSGELFDDYEDSMTAKSAVVELELTGKEAVDGAEIFVEGPRYVIGQDVGYKVIFDQVRGHAVCSQCVEVHAYPETVFTETVSSEEELGRICDLLNGGPK